MQIASGFQNSPLSGECPSLAAAQPNSRCRPGSTHQQPQPEARRAQRIVEQPDRHRSVRAERAERKHRQGKRHDQHPVERPREPAPPSRQPHRQHDRGSDRDRLDGRLARARCSRPVKHDQQDIGEQYEQQPEQRNLDPESNGCDGVFVPVKQRCRCRRRNRHHEQKGQEDDRRVVERQDQPNADRQEEAADTGEIEQRLDLPDSHSGFFLVQRRENDLFAVHGMIEVSTGRLVGGVSPVRTVVFVSRARTFTAMELIRVLR